MPNPHWNNMHGANRTGGAGASNSSRGKAPSSAMPVKTADWPAVPGKTQSRSRAAGQPKTGWKGPFTVKSSGL